MFKIFYIILALCCLSSCQSTITQQNKHSIALQLINSPLTNVKQFAISDNGNIFIINEKGELWDIQKQLLLAETLSTEHSFSVKNNQIAAVDKSGYFFLWTPTQTFSSHIKVSKHSQFLMFEDVIIAVSQQEEEFYLVRIVKQDGAIQITSKSSIPVLPDTRPILAKLSPTQHEEHIVALTNPDSKTYPHGVLGDKLEARLLHYLDNETLQSLATPLSVDNLVFEGNKVNVLQTQPIQLVSVLSGNGQGARVITIQLKNNALQIVAQSNPLPHNRWQDVFTQGDKLYAIQMPHLRKELVTYQIIDNHLQHRLLGNNISTHQIGSYETNLVGITPEFIVLPQADYQSLAWLDKEEKLHFINHIFPSHIIQMKSHYHTVYVLLNNGELWKIDTSVLSQN